MKCKVILVDDHNLVRAALANTVNGMEHFEVVLEAAHGREAVEQLDGLAQSGERAIAIVDLNMPVMDGYETIAWLRKHAPAIMPLALTFDASDEAMMRAVHAGARGFLLKSARPTALKDALNTLLMNGYYYSEEAQEEGLRMALLHNEEGRERERLHQSVTPRELEFLRLVCDPQEFTYAQISDMLSVHRRTVDSYRESLFSKFGVRSKTGLVLFAMRWGLLPGNGH
ncbi:MAG: response regulator transcription factor [Flavobacteriales bacterium]|nr:response regulator transcription factor [Flavobacteriales bacterium]